MPTSSSRVDYHWHPTVHEQWAGEQLYFWKLSFSPTYDRDRIVSGIRRALELQGATAFTMYELFAGGYDIFLRTWLPTSQGAFESALHESLGQYTVVAQAFWVNRIISHWPWETAAGELGMREVPPNVLRNRLPDAEILKINERRFPKARREEYESDNLIVRLPRKKGVKFFTVISTSNQGLTTYATQRLEERIKEVFRLAERIKEKSLYQGVGFGQYLLMGRTTDYFAIDRELTQPLNDVAEPAVYGTRTITFPVSRQDFLAACYDLRVDAVGGAAHTAAEALEGDESQTLEVKGSAFANLDRWLHTEDGLDYDDRLADGLLKAITSLLNADGGTVVVGALERSRFDEHPRLAEMPRLGEYLISGIELDIDGEDWDRWERRLRGLIQNRIEPSAVQWVSVSREEVEGRTVGVISVRAGDRWFYHSPASDSRPRFWVRQGNRTSELLGPEGDVYRHEKAR
jgi:schlafen family protein